MPPLASGAGAVAEGSAAEEWAGMSVISHIMLDDSRRARVSGATLSDMPMMSKCLRAPGRMPVDTKIVWMKL